MFTSPLSELNTVNFSQPIPSQRLAVDKIVGNIVAMDASELRKQLEGIAEKLFRLSQMLDEDESEGEFPPERQSLVEQRICLVCGRELGDGKAVRGTHAYCSRVVNQRIKDGELTDAAAVRAGLFTPKSGGGRGKTEIHERIAAIAQHVVDTREAKTKVSKKHAVEPKQSSRTKKKRS